MKVFPQLANLHNQSKMTTTSTLEVETPSIVPQPVEPTQHENSPSTLDDLMESIVGEGLSFPQLFQSFLVIFAWFFDSQQLFITVFTDAQPSWHCTDTLTCNVKSGSSNKMCQLPRSSWAWDRPAHTSTISEWSLQCGKSFLSGLPASSFFMGCLVGGFVLATLADSVGRKKSILISCLIMSLSSFLAAFSPNIWVYAALRFVSGFGRAALGSSTLVLPTEILGKKWRTRAGVAGFNFATLGFLSLPAIAYLTRDSHWRIIYLSASIPLFLYCILIYMFVSESPRWLLIQGGREDEAITILKKIASAQSKIKLDEEHDRILITTLVSRYINEDRPKLGHEQFLSSIKLLFKKRWALKRLIIGMVVGFSCGASYYGIPQNLDNLTSNLYLSVALNALMEVPANVITLFLIGKWTTRRLLCVMSLAGGVCSIIYGVLVAKMGDHHNWKIVEVGLELLSFSTATMAFLLLHVIGLELFPTIVRNSAVMLLRQSAVIGGIFSPLLIAAIKHNTFLSYVVFGALLVISAVFVIYLPETKINAVFCDTMDEQEYMDKAAVSDVPTSV